MVERQLSITSWPPRFSKPVQARDDAAPVTDAEAFASKPDQSGFTEMTNQDEANVYVDINEPRLLPMSGKDAAAAIGHHRILATPNWKSITGWPACTPCGELNPDSQARHGEVEVSILETDVLSNFVVSTGEPIADRASEKAKIQYYYLLANYSSGASVDSWTLPPPARLPGDSPTRDFVPPWFASQAATQHGQYPRLAFPARAGEHRICSVVSRSRRKLNPRKTTTTRSGTLLTKPLREYRGSDRKMDNQIVGAEPDLRIIIAGGDDDDCTHLTAGLPGDYKPPSLAKIRGSDWWDTGYIYELEDVVKDNMRRRGHEIAA
ncbi:hypothetical protein V1506DRAFT_536731 [Lipomyces tetrasporus]